VGLAMLVPKGKIPVLSLLGTRTMPIYLFHLFLFWGINWALEHWRVSSLPDVAWCGIGLGVCVFSLWLFSLKIFQLPFDALKKLVNTVVEKAYRRINGRARKG
jgi:peptidoglycan/LPS O-acetylase OafA/YrhL